MVASVSRTALRPSTFMSGNRQRIMVLDLGWAASGCRSPRPRCWSPLTWRLVPAGVGLNGTPHAAAVRDASSPSSAGSNSTNISAVSNSAASSLAKPRSLTRMVKPSTAQPRSCIRSHFICGVRGSSGHTGRTCSRQQWQRPERGAAGVFRLGHQLQRAGLDIELGHHSFLVESILKTSPGTLRLPGSTAVFCTGRRVVLFAIKVTGEVSPSCGHERSLTPWHREDLNRTIHARHVQGNETKTQEADGRASEIVRRRRSRDKSCGLGRSCGDGR